MLVAFIAYVLNAWVAVDGISGYFFAWLLRFGLTCIPGLFVSKVMFNSYVGLPYFVWYAL